MAAAPLPPGQSATTEIRDPASHILMDTPAGQGASAWPQLTIEEAEPSGSPAGQLQVEDVMRNVERALKLDFREQVELVCMGHGKHMGTHVAWQLRGRPDGAFWEQLRGPHLSCSFGHDGGVNSSCWQVDYSGVPSRLELDDREAQLMATWVRTGAWLSPHLAGRLRVSLIHTHDCSGTSQQAQGSPGSAQQAMQGHPEAAPQSSQQSALATVAFTRTGMTELQRPNSSDADGGQPSASTQLTADVGASTSASNHVTLALCLSGGKMVSHLRICTATWRPLQLQQPLAGDWETWSYEGWAQWQPRLHFPACTQHLAVSAGGNCYNTDSVQLAARYSLAPYSMPAVALRPPGTHYDPRLPSAVPAWWTVSGHVVVEPVINGRTVGFMILDTGASNCVIERSAADQLGLDAFGSLFVSGMAGKVDSVYRTAATLQLGPLTMKRPLFFEMPLGGLVRGEPGRIIGIVGADVFRRATVELPQPPSHAPGNYRPQPYAVHLHDPETYRAPAAAEAAWQPVLMVSNLPHVYVRMQVADAAQQTKALLLLDSGAGGMDIIFSPRATALLNVPNAATQNLRVIKGVGGSEVNGKQSGRAASTTLDWVQVHQARFKRVQCLLMAQGGLDLSLYTMGLICGNLVARTTVIVDLARQRLAFLPPKADREACGQQPTAAPAGGEGMAQQQRAEPAQRSGAAGAAACLTRQQAGAASRSGTGPDASAPSLGEGARQPAGGASTTTGRLRRPAAQPTARTPAAAVDGKRWTKRGPRKRAGAGG